MAYIDFAARVAETSTTTGTGAFALAAAATGYQRFSAKCSVGDTVHYYIEADDAKWEHGLGAYSALNTLTRTTVIDSSAGVGTAATFAAGNKTVYIGHPGIGALTANATSKTTPVDADTLPISDSAASGVLKRVTWANLKATLKTYFDTLYAAAGSGGGSATWAVKTANYTAVSGDNLLCNTTGGAFTITLPATPATNATVRIKGGPAAATNNLTVARNGSTIGALAEDMTVSQNTTDFTLVYDGSTWRL